MKGKIIVLDDEPLMLRYLEKHLGMHQYEVTAYESPSQALSSLSEKSVDLVISDVKMPEMSGDEVLNHILEHHPGVGVILITGFGSINHAVNTVQKGAFDYITKPFTGPEILARVNRFFKLKEETGQVRHQPEMQAPKTPEPSSQEKQSESPKSKTASGGSQQERYEVKLIGEHPRIKQLVESLPQIAQNNAPVLIQGESGSGKEVFASLVHYNSERAEKPYVKINCANLPSELVESTLFGHVKGAFTGAVSDSKGAFQEADGGTLLLDEITEIDINIQAKLLRVLQESEFTRVGSQKPQKVDVRIVATTNRNVSETIRNGHFREDLYYRLNVFPIAIPPLRERRDDIPVLAQYFVEKYVHEYGLEPKTISEELMQYLKQQSWKGNVRELDNFVQRGVLMSHGSSEITLDHVHNQLFEGVDENLKQELMDDMPLVPIEEMELKMIRMALERTNGNQKEAAELLGVSDRTIRNKIKKLKDDEE